MSFIKCFSSPIEIIVWFFPLFINGVISGAEPNWEIPGINPTWSKYILKNIWLGYLADILYRSLKLNQLQNSKTYSFHLLVCLYWFWNQDYRFHKMIWAAFALSNFFWKKLFFYKIGINHSLKVWHNSQKFIKFLLSWLLQPHCLLPLTTCFGRFGLN